MTSEPPAEGSPGWTQPAGPADSAQRVSPATSPHAPSGQPPHRALATVAFLVPDYDEAIRFFTQVLRFDLLEDTPQGTAKRWVRVAPAGGQGAALLLARAATPAQRAQVGRQGAGRVWLFLHTKDFAADHQHLLAHGVHFVEQPRQEPYGTVVVFEDPWGNRWDLIEPSAD